jgi:hypothetical protein
MSIERIMDLLDFIEGNKMEEVYVTGSNRLNIRFNINDPQKRREYDRTPMQGMTRIK